MSDAPTCNFHVTLSDGTPLNYPEEVLSFLHGSGLSDNDLKYVFSVMFPDIAGAYDKADYYERLADGYFVSCGHLMDELECVVDRLKSGRSGKGYTKLDIALMLQKIMDTCDPREGC